MRLQYLLCFISFSQVLSATSQRRYKPRISAYRYWRDQDDEQSIRHL